MADPGPVVGFDVGEARIGVAVSDPARTVAVPAGTILVQGAPHDVRAAAAIAAEREATAVVVGHPISLSGERGEAARRAEAFADALGSVVQAPVHLQDERLSTREAERDLRAAGAGRRTRDAVDAAAATLILRAFLERPTGAPD